MKLGTQPKQARAAQAWRYAARTIATYRDRYGITGDAPLGASADTDMQKIDAARARAAVDRLRDLSHDRDRTSRRPAPRHAAGRTL
ncbi:hypothetical protein [Propionibacterium cyclohexanicum]|nr:hypothetical protein [Propionibacterium cyclohexanicum]